jgi:hypothetical protein
MGWSEMQFIHNEYNEKLRSIDDKLIQL